MLLQPTWVCVEYHSGKKACEKMLHSFDPDNKKIIRLVYRMENETLCYVARKIIPRRAKFGPQEGDSIRFCFKIPKLSRCSPEPYLIAWFDETGLYVGGYELSKASGWAKSKASIAVPDWTMRNMKEGVGEYLGLLTHSDAFREFCRENRDRIL